MEEDFNGIWELNKALQTLWQSDALSHDWVLPDNFHVHVKVMDNREEWVSFLGLPISVRTKVNRPTEEGRSLAANAIHSLDGMVVREMHRRCSYDQDKAIALLELLTSDTMCEIDPTPEDDKMVEILWGHYEKTGFLSARILDHLNLNNLAQHHVSPVIELIKTLPQSPFQLLTIHDCFRAHPRYGNDLRRQYNQVLHEIARSSILENLAQQITRQPVVVQKYADISAQVLEANYSLS